MTLEQLIEQLQDLPQDKSILCQLIGSDETDDRAWNMFFEFSDVKDSSFIQLKISHPEFKTLPKDMEEK